MPQETTFDLSGVRIWLSGSIPDELGSDAQPLIDFVSKFAAECFRSGATLIHGCHPSLVPILLQVAEEYRTNVRRKAPLRLVASAYFRKNGIVANETLDRLEKESEFRISPADGNEAQSLARMRESLASEADCLVAIGGRWWLQSPTTAGVPAEFVLAIERGIPSFLLGGLGGATQGYVRWRSEILKRLRNGLSDSDNEKLAMESDPENLRLRVLDQISRLPLRRRETDCGERFRILCLDGGGIRGIFTASVLAAWESALERNPDGSKQHAADYFDLIAGTSTGGILAIGLGLGLSGQQMVDFYKKGGASIFPMRTWLQRLYRNKLQFFWTKFSSKPLEENLQEAYRVQTEEVLGTGNQAPTPQYRPAKMSDSTKRLLITAYNMSNDNLMHYRAHFGYNNADDLLAVEVARATSAAPTYFSAAQVADPLAEHFAVDGGVWGNCPALAAISDAVHVLGIPLDRIDVLSIGTTEMPSITGVPKFVTGDLGWAKKAPGLFMKAQVQATIDHATKLLEGRFVRIDASAYSNGMDSVADMTGLNNTGIQVGNNHFEEVAKRFLNGVPAAPWSVSMD